jgi:hypothetical protein
MSAQIASLIRCRLRLPEYLLVVEQGANTAFVALSAGSSIYPSRTTRRVTGRESTLARTLVSWAALARAAGLHRQHRCWTGPPYRPAGSVRLSLSHLALRGEREGQWRASTRRQAVDVLASRQRKQARGQAWLFPSPLSLSLQHQPGKIIYWWLLQKASRGVVVVAA